MCLNVAVVIVAVGWKCFSGGTEWVMYRDERAADLRSIDM